MKRFITVLAGLLVLPAFAEVAPVYYDEIVEYTDEMIDDMDAVETEENQVVENTAKKKNNVSQRATTNRANSRVVSGNAAVSQRGTTSSRVVASSPRSAQQVSARGVTSRAVKTSSRAKTAQQVVQPRSTQDKKAVTARVSTTGSVMTGDRTSASNNYQIKTLSGSGNEPLYKARVGMRRAATSTRLSTASVIPTATTTPVVSNDDIEETTSNLAAVAELTEYCKAQYLACMDNYCNVLDDNQGRCSCSKNLKNYQKTEEALASATESFQDVVQKIKYIGLTTEQVNSLFKETEAELEMKSTSDSSQIKSSLDAIKRKIVDVTTPNASTATTGNISMDVSGLLNADFTAGFDLASFLNMNVAGSDANNISNQRGEQLHKTATQRCKTAVLNSCVAQGIEANIITNSYDLEIDKQCIAYERDLNEANEEMRNNVRNASTILQQARLMLAQNKNAYDFRGCIAAIDSCMQDEYVCGSDYSLCLDPTGKYLANAEIVKGGAPGVSGGSVKNTTALGAQGTNIEDWVSQGMYSLYSTWNYTDSSANTGTGNLVNAFGGGKKENLSKYIDKSLESWKNNYTNNSATDDMATYILQKIGYIDNNDKVHGMCASVMKQCQDYTFSGSTKNKKYVPDNEVIRQYLASVLTKIKLQQDSILANYAEDCRSDVTSCLTTNGYDESNTTTTASKTAVNACRADIVTCMSVSGYTPKDGGSLSLRMMSDWVATMLLSCPENYYLDDTGGNDNVTCQPCGMAGNVPLESTGGQSTMCYCPDGYTATATNSSTGHPTTCTRNNNN
ncbi:MAG: hypothetical protein J6W27_01335 [Alphaproteobacteria bacterium]|nr:hypothetical protein [Alphaproteobacteria bacterium]